MPYPMSHNQQPQQMSFPQQTSQQSGSSYYDDLRKRGIILPGQSVPGYNPQQLPQTLMPSMQYWSRMGPQFQQQYYGYQRARTGAIPEESQWRVWRQAPPGGANRGLRYQR